MTNNMLKKGIVSLMLTSGLLLGIGAFSTTAAQNRRWEGQRRVEPQQRRGGQVESTGNIDRNKNGIDDRFETRDGRVDIDQDGVADQDERNGRYGRNRGYGNNGYGNRGYENNGYYGNRGYENNGYYGNDGYYGNRGYGINSEFQKGYRDGLNRGREDAVARRTATPNNSSHYRYGNTAYREGFERGFFEAYRQYSGRRW